MVRTIAAAAIAVLAASLTTQSASADAPSPKTPAVAPVDARLQTSADRLDQIQALRDASDANPQRYGGVATAGDANITICDNGGPADVAADAAVAALRESGAQVVVQPCRRTLAELNKVLAAVPSSRVFTDSHVTLTRWGIDFDRNAVMIGVEKMPSGLAEKVAAQWGEAAYLIVKAPSQFQAGSRTADFPPFFGGDYITSAGTLCSSGFTLTNLYGTHYAITAGHCFPLNSAVNTGGSNMGNVYFRTLGGGQNDAELIGGVSYAGKVWVGAPGAGGNTWLPVHNAQNSCNGCSVYENGAVTGQAPVQLSGSPYCDNIGGIVSCNVQDAYSTGAVACRGGDSGNPVFAYDGNGGLTAVGIHHAGDGAGFCSYTQLPPILSYWASTITTA